MADPLSIFVSVGAAAKLVCQSTVSLNSFIEGVIHIDQSVLALLDEFNSLKNVASAIADTVSSYSIRDQAWLADDVQDIFPLLEGSLKGCNDNLQLFKAALIEVKNSRFTAKVLRQPITQIKLDMKSSQIVLLRGQIASHFSAMQLGLQTINLSASIRAPELVVDVLGSKINDDMSNLSSKVQDKFEGLDTKILERMDGLERLITQSSQRLNAQFASFETSSIPVADNEIQLKDAAVRVVSSARSVVSSRSTAADGSVCDVPAHQGTRIHDSSIYGSVLGDEKLERIARWNSGLEILAEGSETSIGIESSHWTAPTNDSDSEDEMADDMFNGLAEKGEIYYKEGKIAEAEIILRKALKLTTTNLRSRSTQKLNDTILRLASIYSELAKFSEAKETLAQLSSLAKVDLLPWEVQQNIMASHLLAKAHLELKEFNEAEKHCKDAMRARRRTFGKNSPDYQESLKLLLAIHEAHGDAGPFVTSPRDRSGRNSVTSSYTGSLLSSPPIPVQSAPPARPASRADSNPSYLRQQPKVQGHELRAKHKPSPVHRKSDTTLESVSESNGGEGGIPSNLPREMPNINHSNAAASLNLQYTQDEAKLESAFTYLETHSGYSFLSPNFDPQAALKTAIHEKHIAVAWSLLNHLAKVEQRYLEKMHYCTSTGLKENSAPFPEKLDVNYSDDKGPLLFQTLWPEASPSLDASTISHQCDMARVLLEAGSNPNIKWSGLTALLKASDGAQMDFVKVLVEAGADISCKDKDGHTPLYLALLHSDSRAEELVCRLVQYGADVNTGFKNGSITALTWVALYGWEKAATAFLKRGAKTERKSGTSFASPLGAAASQGFVSIVRLLLDDGANIEGMSYETDTFGPPLYVAARNGESEVVELLLSRGADIEGKDTVGEDTALSIAACVGEREIVKILLDHKANINATDDENRTPLHLACLHKNEEIVQMLLKHGANVDARNDEFGTPLSCACAVRSKDIVKTLLKYNPDVNLGDEDSLTPLHVACITGCADIAHMLLGRGADVDAQSEGATALHAAAMEGHDEIVRILLDHNADTQFKHPGGLTALEIALEEKHHTVVQALVNHEEAKGPVEESKDPTEETKNSIEEIKGATEETKVTIEETKNPAEEAKHPVEETRGPVVDGSKDASASLLSACKAGALLIVEKLLRSGADIETRGAKSNTPLTAAASRGYSKVVSLLLQSGAKVNAKAVDGLTALYFAAEKGHDAVVRELIEYGADLECAPNNEELRYNGRSPLCIASRYGHEQVLMLLPAGDAKIDAADAAGNRPLHLAAANGHPSVVKLLVNRGANINARNNNKNTPLFMAAERGCTEAIQILLTSGANKEAECCNKLRPLHMAAMSGHSSAVRILTDSGANVKAIDMDEFTALYKAARKGHLECVQILFERGAEVKATGYKSLRPLSAAAKYGHCSTVEFLVSKGANVDAAADDGFTPLKLAVEQQRLDVVKLLLKLGANPKLPEGGWTPLKLAVERENREIEKLLRDAEAEA